jgi:hypothetical protein
LAFAVVTYSIILQRRELRHQYIEFKKSADAQQESSEALRAQLEAMEEQTRLSIMPFPVLVRSPSGIWEYKNMGTSLALNIILFIFDASDGSIQSQSVGHLDAGVSESLPFMLDDTEGGWALLTVYHNIIMQPLFLLQYQSPRHAGDVVDHGNAGYINDRSDAEAFIRTFMRDNSYP